MRFALALTTGAIVAGSILPARAGDVQAGQQPVRLAAAEESISTLGPLRGAIDHDPALSALIERDRMRTRAQPLPSGPKPDRQQASIPSPQRVDQTMTGSALPAGVDPMITGSNR